jgi:hypothetical protein
LTLSAVIGVWVWAAEKLNDVEGIYKDKESGMNGRFAMELLFLIFLTALARQSSPVRQAQDPLAIVSSHLWLSLPPMWVVEEEMK